MSHGDTLTGADLDILFREARTYKTWTDRPVSDDTLRQIHDLAKFGATEANCCPLRVIYVRSKEAKERLRPILDKGNVDQTMAAPVTAIFGTDFEFYEKMPKLFPHTDARAWFVGKEEKIRVTAIRSANLQAAYYMLAARSLGLDCGPMSGFKKDEATREFFAGKFGGKVEANFLCNMGYGTPEGLYPRGPRLDFSEAIEIV